MYKPFNYNDPAFLENSDRPIILLRGGDARNTYYTNDGINLRTVYTPTGTMGTAIYSPELKMFITADLNSPWEIHRSTDGINWTSAVSPGSGTRGIRGADVYNGEIYLNRTTTVIKSSDGINWTTFTRNDTANGNGIAVNSNIIVANSSGTTTQRLQSSPDGTTWTNRLDTGGSTGAVHWIEDWGLFIAFSPGIGNFYTSTDGTSWTTRTVPSIGTANNRYPNGTYSKKLGMFIMVNCDNAIRYSTNGTTFTLATLPGGYTGRPQAVAWVDKLNEFIAYGNTSANAASNIVLKSSDGITWTQHTATFTVDAVRIAVKQ